MRDSRAIEPFHFCICCVSMVHQLEVTEEPVTDRLNVVQHLQPSQCKLTVCAWVRAAYDHIWASTYHVICSCAYRDVRAVTHLPAKRACKMHMVMQHAHACTRGYEGTQMFCGIPSRACIRSKCCNISSTSSYDRSSGIF